MFKVMPAIELCKKHLKVGNTLPGYWFCFTRSVFLFFCYANGNHQFGVLVVGNSRSWACQVPNMFKCLAWCSNCCTMSSQFLVWYSQLWWRFPFDLVHIIKSRLVYSNGCFSEWLKRCQEKHSSVLCPQCRAVVQFVGRNHFLHGIEEVLGDHLSFFCGVGVGGGGGGEAAHFTRSWFQKGLFA